MSFNSWFDLPVYVQVVFGAGYLGYFVSRQGYMHVDTTSDRVFGAIVYSLVASALVHMFDSVFSLAIGFTYALAIAGTVLIAVLWRTLLREGWYKLLRIGGIAGENNEGPVWNTLIQNRTLSPSQVYVTTKSGEQLRCKNMEKTHNYEVPGGLFDREGNIALYVTHIKENGEWVEQTKLAAGDWGHLLTYIPVGEIAKIDIRYAKS